MLLSGGSDDEQGVWWGRLSLGVPRSAWNEGLTSFASDGACSFMPRDPVVRPITTSGSRMMMCTPSARDEPSEREAMGRGSMLTKRPQKAARVFSAAVGGRESPLLSGERGHSSVGRAPALQAG